MSIFSIVIVRLYYYVDGDVIRHVMGDPRLYVATRLGSPSLSYTAQLRKGHFIKYATASLEFKNLNWIFVE